MFSRPVYSDYSSYGHYALAAVGFAVLSSSTLNRDCGGVIGGTSRSTSRVGDDVDRGDFQGEVGSGTLGSWSVVARVSPEGREYLDVECGGVTGCKCVDTSRCGSMRGRNVDLDNCSSDKREETKRATRENDELRDGLKSDRSKRQNKRDRQREKKKTRVMDGDWRVRDGGDMIEQNRAPGAFWDSTSAEVRQRLIDSKARMHIAENEKREREARERIAYLDSPEAAMHKAIGMIDYAQKQAKKENDNKVYGWAKTVATSSAESLARSTPDSVPSFDEVSARIEASSQSSFELELKAKQDELDDERRKNALLENEIREEKRAKEEVVAKSKHEAVVHRMRQLETQISENNKKAERVNFRRNRVEEMRNAQGETEKQMRARMAKLSPEEHQREVVRLMRERAWENS